MAPTTYVDVIVNIPALGDRVFTYSTGRELPFGAKVRVPFGPSVADGFVVGWPSSGPGKETKSVTDVYDPDYLPDPHLLQLCDGLSRYYCASRASLWSCLWPPVVPRVPMERLVAGRRSTEYLPPLEAGEVARLCSSVHAEMVVGSESFRTQRYTEAIQETLSRGQGVLVLSPTAKGASALRAHIGDQFEDDAALLHSSMTGVVRRNQWLALMKGQKRVGFGTRSAVFVPMPSLGLVIVDDERNDSYKSIEWPPYDARTVALLRASSGAVVMLGSDSPSVKAYWHMREGTWSMTKAPQETKEREALLVDMRGTRPTRDALSEPLLAELRRVFDGGQRALLFLNRRGDRTHVSCLDCGAALLCPRCGVPLVLHGTGDGLLCHTCGQRSPAPLECPACGGHRWRLSGFGSQRAESEFLEKFPNIPVFRVDSDVSRAGIRKAEAAFGSEAPSCLVATKIVFGLDLPEDLGVVGVLSADAALGMPDFRASEGAFQLLRGLSGMVAGGPSPGVFVLQTRNPEHHAIQGAIDPSLFYDRELESRRMLGYPPFLLFWKIRFGGRTLPNVKEAAEAFVRFIEEESLVTVLGPVPAPHPKRRGIYWWQAALRGDDHGLMADAFGRAMGHMKGFGSVRVLVDVEPVDME